MNLLLVLLTLGMPMIATCATSTVVARGSPEERILFDPDRKREIPIGITPPAAKSTCAKTNACPVAFVSPGYGLSHTDYAFLVEPLAMSGYLVVTIQSVLPSDPKLANTGDLIAERTPMWERGADNLAFVKRTLSEELSGYDWGNLALIGHSNGGDISALAATRDPAFAGTLITLDHRRYPLPRSKALKLLSIRGSDFPADPGVLPNQQEATALGYCIVTVANARHNDMQDSGPGWLKATISETIVGFLTKRHCNA